MPIRISEVDRPQANEVLARLKSMLRIDTTDGYATIKPYENGREHGWYVSFWPKGVNQVRAVSFSEYRNSDDIVVYYGEDWQFDSNCHIPNEDVYRNAKFLPHSCYETAAAFVYQYLLDIK